MSDQKKPVSKAPPPISPLNGRSSVSYRPQAEDQPTPNWFEWKNTPEVRLWQACALSIGIDPHSMKHSPNGWMAGPGTGPFFEPESFPNKEAKTEFELRMRILLANLSNRTFFSPGLLHMSIPGNHTVRLSEFAAWGLSIGWGEMPPELLALSKSEQRASNTPTAKPTADVLPSDDRLSSWALTDETYKDDPAWQRKYARAHELLAEQSKWERMDHKNDPFRENEIEKKLSEIRREWDELNKVAQTVESLPPAKTNDGDGHRVEQSNPEVWKIKAEEFANEYIDRHRKKNLFPSQSDVCRAVESKLRTEGIYGSHGKPVSAAYIQRNAIQGDWWKNNKP